MVDSKHIVLWSGDGFGFVFTLTFHLSPNSFPQFSEEQRFNSFLKALREKVEVKQLSHFWEIVVQGKVSFFPPNTYAI